MAILPPSADPNSGIDSFNPSPAQPPPAQNRLTSSTQAPGPTVQSTPAPETVPLSMTITQVVQEPLNHTPETPTAPPLTQNQKSRGKTNLASKSLNDLYQSGKKEIEKGMTTAQTKFEASKAGKTWANKKAKFEQSEFAQDLKKISTGAQEMGEGATSAAKHLAEGTADGIADSQLGKSTKAGAEKLAKTKTYKSISDAAKKQATTISTFWKSNIQPKITTVKKGLAGGAHKITHTPLGEIGHSIARPFKGAAHSLAKIPNPFKK